MAFRCPVQPAPGLLTSVKCRTPFKCALFTRHQSHTLQYERLTVSAEASDAPQKRSDESAPQQDQPAQQQVERPEAQRQMQRGRRRQADSTDWFATNITRRFGLAGGLAWLGFLTFGKFTSPASLGIHHEGLP